MSAAYYVPRTRACADPRTPAGRIVRQLGGPAATARLAGVSLNAVYRWLAPRAGQSGKGKGGGGTGGRVPARAQDRLIQAAEAEGLALAHVDFAPKPGERFT
jgi:hypothetical protein